MSAAATSRALTRLDGRGDKGVDDDDEAERVPARVGVAGARVLAIPPPARAGRAAAAGHVPAG
jgi:hypothetical protein